MGDPVVIMKCGKAHPPTCSQEFSRLIFLINVKLLFKSTKMVTHTGRNASCPAKVLLMADPAALSARALDSLCSV